MTTRPNPEDYATQADYTAACRKFEGIPRCPRCNAVIIPEEPRPGCASWYLHAETKSYECALAQSEATGTPEPERIQKMRQLVAELNNSSDECLLALSEISDFELQRELAQVTASRDAMRKALEDIRKKCCEDYDERDPFEAIGNIARAALSQKEKT